MMSCGWRVVKEWAGRWCGEGKRKSANMGRNMGSSEWYEAIVGGKRAEDIARRIERREYYPWLEPLLSHTAAGDSLLELGSGTGELSAALAREGRSTALLDFSEEALRFENKLYSLLGLKGNFYCSDLLQTLPLPDGAVDWAWSSGVLEHFTDEEIRRVLRESARVASKGVMALVPNARSVFYRVGKYKREREGTWQYGREEPRFTLRDLFEEAGLVDIEEYTLGVRNALKFWGEKDKDVLRFLEAFGEKELERMDQGYLLFTRGVKRR